MYVCVCVCVCVHVYVCVCVAGRGKHWPGVYAVCITHLSLDVGFLAFHLH